MPVQSRYSNEEFEALMHDVFLTLEKNKSPKDLSIMVLGNVLANIFQNQIAENSREDMVEHFCAALRRSTMVTQQSENVSSDPQQQRQHKKGKPH
jgi:uncharacterized protein YejL (UPF0352 family)